MCVSLYANMTKLLALCMQGCGADSGADFGATTPSTGRVSADTPLTRMLDAARLTEERANLKRHTHLHAGYVSNAQMIRVAHAQCGAIRIPTIDPACITSRKRIGRGHEGVVYGATLEGVGDVALKCLQFTSISAQDQAQVQCPPRYVLRRK